jgi:hypothetical protein
VQRTAEAEQAETARYSLPAVLQSKESKRTAITVQRRGSGSSGGWSQTADNSANDQQASSRSLAAQRVEQFPPNLFMQTIMHLLHRY